MTYQQAPYRPSYETHSSPDDRRSVAKWMLGMVAVVALVITSGFVVLFQISAEAPANRSLARASAALTEIDLLLDRHYDDLQAQAEAADPGVTIKFDEYPIELSLTKEDVAGVPKDQLRTTILDKSSARLYDDGTEVLRESAEDASSLGLFSAAGFVDRWLSLLTADSHRTFAIVLAIAGIIAVVLLLLTAAACRDWGRLMAISFALTATGVILLGIAGLSALYSDSQSGGSEYLRSELFTIMNDHALVAAYDGAAVAIAGLVLLLLVAIGRRISRRSFDSFKRAPP